MTKDALHEYLLSKSKAFLDHPFGLQPDVYKVQVSQQVSKMFALLADKNQVLRLSLKCDPLLATTLRERYESVLPGYHLNKQHWNTLILSGQLSQIEVLALIDHSYQLVTNAKAYS